MCVRIMLKTSEGPNPSPKDPDTYPIVKDVGLNDSLYDCCIYMYIYIYLYHCYYIIMIIDTSVIAFFR